IGENGAEHGGDHSVDEDGENGGEDQHAGRFLSRERARARRRMRLEDCGGARPNCTVRERGLANARSGWVFEAGCASVDRCCLSIGELVQ
ncbi:MAG TPA: hypothetical protein VMW15_04575, partial [Terracidiphilus sp.]|nr:hypothetical protein [Terracidiphilus sp.]